MTAVPNWDIVGPSGADAELALASAAGDRDAFAAIYDRYADRLHDFCVGMLRDREGAADCVQDTFCIAATRLTQLREPDKLRPWLYAIARSEALRRIRDRRRETVSDELPDAESHEPGPYTLAARSELADLVTEAAGGLSDRDRSVLELAYRHGLDGADLADALGVSQSNANTIVHRLRETIERALGALLVSRHVQNNPEDCPELAAILVGWDGHFGVLMRKRIARHIESCAACDEERQRRVSPVALLGATPVFLPAPALLRERTLKEVELTAADTPITDANGGGTVRERGEHGFVVPVVAFVAALIAAVALIFVWLNQKDVPIAPTDATETVSPTSAKAPAPKPPPPPAPAVKPPDPVTPPPTRRAPEVQPPSPQPPVSPPVAEPPPPPPLPEEPPVPPVPPEPPVWPPPGWPQWPPPDWPQPPPPPGGDSGLPRVIVDPPPPPPGGSRPCSTVRCP